MTFSDFYFGIDSDSVAKFTCPGNGPNFYIGKLGAETTPGGGTAWSPACASLATPPYTHSYWDVAGPDGRTGSTAVAWGEAQANEFYKTWKADSLVKGSTLFGDIEPRNGGWLTDIGSNRAVIAAFLNTINNKGDATAGVYVTQTNWNDYFGSTWTSTAAFVLWLADSFCSVDTCVKAQDYFNSTITNINLGGYKTMLWQYNINTCGASANNSDLDITPYNGYESGSWNPTLA